MNIAIASADRVRVEALHRVIREQHPILNRFRHEVTWIAHDGAGAVELCTGARPDLMLLDVDLPGLGCVEVTRQVMSASPCGILLLSRGWPDSARAADVGSIFNAMVAGALDVVAAPWLDAEGNLTGSVPVTSRLDRLAMLIRIQRRVMPPPIEGPPSRGVLVATRVGSGGPKALQTLLRGLPRDLPAALLIVQDIEPDYADGLVSWLQQETGFPVKRATPGASLLAGTALFAPASARIVVMPDNTVQPNDEPPEATMAVCMHAEQSMDEFFDGLMHHTPGIAVSLDGQERYPTQSLFCLQRAGWLTISQGAPGNSIDSITLPVEAIAPTVVAAVARMSR